MKKKTNNLKGIWKNKGFEKIDNLEKELKEIRKEITEAILKKNYKPMRKTCQIKITLMPTQLLPLMLVM